jgi:hypothetical protein
MAFSHEGVSMSEMKVTIKGKGTGATKDGVETFEGTAVID